MVVEGDVNVNEQMESRSLGVLAGHVRRRCSVVIRIGESYLATLKVLGKL